MALILKTKPKRAYCGLTIVLSNPSRFDVTAKELLSGGGWYLEQCMAPYLHKDQCEIRVADDPAPFLPNTKVLLVLGEYAHRKLSGLKTTLDENRGSPYYIDNIPTIASFFPQDCVDIKDHEVNLNREAKTAEDIAELSYYSDIEESKGRGSTSWANYRFWLKKDVFKAIAILSNDGKIPDNGYKPNYHIQPDEDFLVKLLRSKKGKHFVYDKETDPITGDMRCFAFLFDDDPENIYIVPTLDINYKCVYSGYNSAVMLALAIAIRDNIVVAHNGAHFDFLILALKYRIAIKKVYDTMCAQHKIYPTIEKSLGHCVSLWTYEPYHKNEGVHTYLNNTQAQQLYLYCGKDIFTTFLVWKAQMEFAAKDAGLMASIQQSNDSIRPYLTDTLLGMHFNEERRTKWINESDRLCTFYFKVIENLTGPTVEPLISNKKCVEYFHRQLAYPVVKFTPTGGISCDETALLKLALKHNNPVINFLLKYRGKQKEVGTLNFKVWAKEPKFK